MAIRKIHFIGYLCIDSDFELRFGFNSSTMARSYLISSYIWQSGREIVRRMGLSASIGHPFLHCSSARWTVSACWRRGKSSEENDWWYLRFFLFIPTMPARERYECRYSYNQKSLNLHFLVIALPSHPSHATRYRTTINIVKILYGRRMERGVFMTRLVALAIYIVFSWLTLIWCSNHNIMLITGLYRTWSIWISTSSFKIR